MILAPLTSYKVGNQVDKGIVNKKKDIRYIQVIVLTYLGFKLKKC